MKIKDRIVIVLAVILLTIFIAATVSQGQSGSFTLPATDPCSIYTTAKSSAAVPGSNNTDVAASGSTVIYVCGFGLTRTDSSSTKFSYGTSTQCSGGTGTALTGSLFTSTDTASFVAGNNSNTILVVPSGNALCSSGGGQGFVTYVQK